MFQPQTLLALAGGFALGSAVALAQVSPVGSASDVLTSGPLPPVT